MRLIAKIGLLLFVLMNTALSQTREKVSIVQGVLLLNQIQVVLAAKITQTLQANWGLKATELKVGKDGISFKTAGIQFVLKQINKPLLTDEIFETAKVAYLWPEAETEIKKHRAQWLLTAVQGDTKKLKVYEVFTKVASVCLKNADATGIYFGRKMVLLSKVFYVAEAEVLRKGVIPMNNWVYVGSVSKDGIQSVYTYGLTLFGKQEMEIVDSKRPTAELRGLLYNLISYVLKDDVVLKEEEAIVLDKDNRLIVHIFEGKFIQGPTIKIEY